MTFKTEIKSLSLRKSIFQKSLFSNQVECTTPLDMTNTVNICGTYKLKTYGHKFKKTGEFKPISDWYAGEIHYCSSGRMSVLVRFAKEASELSEVVAYSGTYKIEGDFIHHHVTMSIKPGYENQTLMRRFSFSNGVLQTEFENTEEFWKFADWELVEPK